MRSKVGGEGALRLGHRLLSSRSHLASKQSCFFSCQCLQFPEYPFFFCISSCTLPQSSCLFRFDSCCSSCLFALFSLLLHFMASQLQLERCQRWLVGPSQLQLLHLHLLPGVHLDNFTSLRMCTWINQPPPGAHLNN